MNKNIGVALVAVLVTIAIVGAYQFPQVQNVVDRSFGEVYRKNRLK